MLDLVKKMASVNTQFSRRLPLAEDCVHKNRMLNLYCVSCNNSLPHMSSIKLRLLDYVQTVSGQRPDLTTVVASTLPLFLRQRYSICTARLFGRKTFLAIESKDWECATPGEYAKHAQMLGVKLGAPVVVVLPILPSHARNRMVHMGIPFIIPGSQIFIPGGMIDLRERFPKPKSKREKSFSPATQCALLYHLLREPLAKMSLKDIARRIQYSPMMMSKVKDELEAANICRTARAGRSMVLEFTATGGKLWQQLAKELVTPVKRKHWIRWGKRKNQLLLAGMSALSARTMIGDDRLPTYALTLGMLGELLSHGTCEICHDSDNATAQVEIWSYDPNLLGDGKLVDHLSLYLSMSDSPDERVQQQLEILLGQVKW